MKSRKKEHKVLWILIGIAILVIIGITLGILCHISQRKIYEGNHLKFQYDHSLSVSSREQNNCWNITVSDDKGDVAICSVVIKLDNLDEQLFFQSIEKSRSGKSIEMTELITGTANDKKGRKVYREYEALDIANRKLKILAQVQSLQNDYYIFTLAYIEENFEENTRLARLTMDSVVYSDVEKTKNLKLTENFIPLFDIHSFMLSHIDKDTSLYTRDLDKAYEEHMESLPADLTLKEVENYQYLMQIDIASADGNIYPVMVPKDYDADGEKRFITYLDNGFQLSMYARELFQGETLSDALENTNNFVFEEPDRNFVNVEKTEFIEKDGLIYQICTADSVAYDGEVIPKAEIAAVIPLGGDDVLFFSLSLEDYSYNSSSRKYLEELERYYGLPVTQFADLMNEISVP